MSDHDFVSADGSPLALYLAIPPGREPEVVHAAIPEKSTILELGSGPGRITRVLIALGHQVTAVDDSEEMLEHVTGAEVVRADIYDMDLSRRYDVVLAGSHLINDPDPHRRRALLEVCAAHMLRNGQTLIERYPPGWLDDPAPFDSKIGMVDMAFNPIEIDDGVVTASMTYRLAGREWVQEFSTTDIDDETLAVEAEEAGLTLNRTLSDDGGWVELVASPA